MYILVYWKNKERCFEFYSSKESAFAKVNDIGGVVFTISEGVTCKAKTISELLDDATLCIR